MCQGQADLPGSWIHRFGAEDRNLQDISADQAGQILAVQASALQACQVLKDAGWDFTNTWVEKDGDYPRLWWE
jgi:hypothetical protein